MKRDEGAGSLREETRWKVENEKVKRAGGKLRGKKAQQDRRAETLTAERTNGPRYEIQLSGRAERCRSLSSHCTGAGTHLMRIQWSIVVAGRGGFCATRFFRDRQLLRPEKNPNSPRLPSPLPEASRAPRGTREL